MQTTLEEVFHLFARLGQEEMSRQNPGLAAPAVQS